MRRWNCRRRISMTWRGKWACKKEPLRPQRPTPSHAFFCEHEFNTKTRSRTKKTFLYGGRPEGLRYNLKEMTLNTKARKHEGARRGRSCTKYFFVRPRDLRGFVLNAPLS